MLIAHQAISRVQQVSRSHGNCCLCAKDYRIVTAEQDISCAAVASRMALAAGEKNAAVVSGIRMLVEC
jgi:hypothetical protein